MPEFATVTTQRLLLRPVNPDDLDALFAINTDPRTWRHDPAGRHTEIATTRAWIERAAARWDSDGLSYWTVLRAADGEVIGVGGAQRQVTRAWNLYYRFTPTAWGNGYATELSRAALSAAAAIDPSVPVIAWVDEVNTASRRLAERLGLVDRGLRRHPDGSTMIAYSDRALPPDD